MEIKYEPTKESISEHSAPEWFHDAKFGIFIHWSLSSVPGYATVREGGIWDLVAEHGFAEHFKNNPYAEWYQNTINIPGSPAQKYHAEKYGADFAYHEFTGQFNQAAAGWDPGEWAQLFKEVGAEYVVMVTKHHDGFLLWPGSSPNPYHKDYHATRDLVGELSGAVKSRGMRMGLYYSGGLDWTFNEGPITDAADFMVNGPVSREYADYVDAHFRELIDRYEPAILWNDICYPPAGDLFSLLAYYYNRVPDGAVNDRWSRISVRGRKLMTSWPIRNFINRTGAYVVSKMGTAAPRLPRFADYATPEYVTLSSAQKIKWECVRGIGHSFGYNRMETEEHYMKSPEAIRMLVDIVSKNGNLLLDIGPRADGSIPQEQLECLRGLGRWLEVNGEAIYGTRPWTHAQGETECGARTRYTKKNDRLYAIVLDACPKSEMEIKNITAAPKTEIKLIGRDGLLEWEQRGANLKVSLPDDLPESPAHSFMISPPPVPVPE